VEIGRSPTLPLLAFRTLDGVVLVNMTGDPVAMVPGSEPLQPWTITVGSRTE
jgi:hypothetical protein